MARKFVRNITGTKLRGNVKTETEPLKTNTQNDLLSDLEDVFVRNKKEYHALTDNIKIITSENDTIEIEQTGKNSVEIIGLEMSLDSLDDKLIISKNSTNNFTLDLDLSNYYTILQVDNRLGEKAEKSDLDELETVVNSKADKSEVELLAEKITNLETRLDELEV